MSTAASVVDDDDDEGDDDDESAAVDESAESELSTLPPATKTLRQSRPANCECVKRFQLVSHSSRDTTELRPAGATLECRS